MEQHDYDYGVRLSAWPFKIIRLYLVLSKRRNPHYWFSLISLSVGGSIPSKAISNRRMDPNRPAVFRCCHKQRIQSWRNSVICEKCKATECCSERTLSLPTGEIRRLMWFKWDCRVMLCIHFSKSRYITDITHVGSKWRMQWWYYKICLCRCGSIGRAADL